MAIKLSASEQLTFSTVRLECRLRDGTMSTGSGFFFRCCDDGKQHIPVIVTNRHVVAGAVSGRFHLHQKDQSGDPIAGKHQGYELTSFESRWFGHPDPDVDLCAMPIMPLVAEMQRQGHSAFYVALDKSLLLTKSEDEELTALEDVVLKTRSSRRSKMS
jgi:hypothetical protein